MSGGRLMTESQDFNIIRYTTDRFSQKILLMTVLHKVVDEHIRHVFKAVQKNHHKKCPVPETSFSFTVNN